MQKVLWCCVLGCVTVACMTYLTVSYSVANPNSLVGSCVLTTCRVATEVTPFSRLGYFMVKGISEVSTNLSVAPVLGPTVPGVASQVPVQETPLTEEDYQIIRQIERHFRVNAGPAQEACEAPPECTGLAVVVPEAPMPPVGEARVPCQWVGEECEPGQKLMPVVEVSDENAPTTMPYVEEEAEVVEECTEEDKDLLEYLLQVLGDVLNQSAEETPVEEAVDPEEDEGVQPDDCHDNMYRPHHGGCPYSGGVCPYTGKCPQMTHPIDLPEGDEKQEEKKSECPKDAPCAQPSGFAGFLHFIFPPNLCIKRLLPVVGDANEEQEPGVVKPEKSQRIYFRNQDEIQEDFPVHEDIDTMEYRRSDAPKGDLKRIKW